MKTLRTVSDARWNDLPAGLQEAATWPTPDGLVPLAGAKPALSKTWPSSSVRGFIDSIREFVAQSFLPAEPLVYVFADPSDEAGLELRHQTKLFRLRARRFDLLLDFTEPRPWTGDSVDSALSIAKQALAVPLTDPATSAPLPRLSSRAFPDGAFVEFGCPVAGGFLGGMSPALSVYAEPKLLLCSFYKPVDRRTP